MATVHVYVRQQVKTDDPAAIEAAVEALKNAVEAAGDSFTGTVQVESDVVEPGPEPAE